MFQSRMCSCRPCVACPALLYFIVLAAGSTTPALDQCTCCSYPTATRRGRSTWSPAAAAAAGTSP